MAKAVSSFLIPFIEKNVELFVPGVTFKWLGLRRKQQKRCVKRDCFVQVLKPL